MKLQQKRFMWKLDSDFDEIIFRLREINAQRKIYNTLSTYLFNSQEVMILESMTEVTEDDPHETDGDGLYGEPESSYTFTLFDRSGLQWKPISINETIDRETFYKYTTSKNTDKIISCLTINCEHNEKSYRFDFNFEKRLNTLTIVDDDSNIDKALSPFLKNVKTAMSEDEYRRIIFDDTLEILPNF